MPTLSLVVCGRNDDYGLTFGARFQTFLGHLAALSESHKALFELVVVEWNPPPDKPPMSRAFDWSGLEDLSRVITVPSDVHEAIPNVGGMPLLEFWAKNVGVRRAAAPFVLSTNPDILISPAFFDWIASGELNVQAFYRADRYDFAAQIAVEAQGRDIYDRAMESVFEVHTRNTIDPEEPMSHFVDPAKSLNEWPQSQPFYNDKLSEDGSIIISGRRQNPLSGLHTQASGDFMLASKRAWEAVRGHWERTDTFTHLDSYLVCHLHAAGFTQCILRRPIMVLHMDHSRDEQKSRPVRPYSETLEEIRQCAAGSLPNPNGIDWGLAGSDLLETAPATRHRRRPPGKLGEVPPTLSVKEHLKILGRAYAIAAIQSADASRQQVALSRRAADLQMTLEGVLGAVPTAELQALRARAADATALQSALAEAQANTAALQEQLDLAEGRNAQIAELEQAVAIARTVEVRLQEQIAYAESEAAAQSRRVAKLEADHLIALKLAEQHTAEMQQLAEHYATQLVELQGSFARVETANAALEGVVAELEAENAAARAGKQALEQALLETQADRDRLQALLTEKGDTLAENRARVDVLEDRLRQLRAEADDAHAAARTAREVAILETQADRDRLQALLTEKGETLAENRARVELLEDRLKQLRAEADDAHAALRTAREVAAREATDRAAADTRYDEIIRLLGVVRAEEIARVRHEYERRLADLGRLSLEAEQIAQQLDTERRMQREQAVAHQALIEAERSRAHQAADSAERTLAHEKAQRNAAEALLRALETESVDRERRVGALEESLAEAQRRRSEAEAERDSTLAAYKSIMENSRYMRARRSLMRLLGRPN